MTGDHIESSLRRLEDKRFLTGQGRYVDDVAVLGQLHGVVLRSPHGHALIEGIEAAAARTMPGVRGLFTAADLHADKIGTLPCIAQVATVAPMIVPPRRALARDRVRHVGDPVVFVVADTVQQARDAAERVAVNYRPLPAVIEAREALSLEAPLLWDEAPGNLSYRFERGDKPAVAAAFAKAAHIVEIELVNNRLLAAPIEPRAAIGTYDAASDRFDLLLTGQGVHSLRRQLAEAVFHMPPDHIALRAPDVGGGFGVKNFLYPEWVLVLWAARRLGRPAKWVAERGEEFVSARPRQSYAGALGARPRRWVSRPRCRHGGQSRRLSVHQRPRQFDQFAGQRHGRGLRHPGRVHGGARRLHKHAADRCLSRRRQARSQLPDRAACGSRRAPAGNRSHGVAPA